MSREKHHSTCAQKTRERGRTAFCGRFLTQTWQAGPCARARGASLLGLAGRRDAQRVERGVVVHCRRGEGMRLQTHDAASDRGGAGSTALASHTFGLS